MKTLIVQDGTNSLLKSRNASVDDSIQNYLELIKKVDEKFNPNKIVLITVPPLRNNPGNKYHNSRIDEINTKIRKHLETKSQIINIHEITESMKDYNVLLHDEIHFNYRNGIPFLKNQVLLHCSGSSNGIIAGRPISNYYLKLLFEKFMSRLYKPDDKITTIGVDFVKTLSLLAAGHKVSRI